MNCLVKLYEVCRVSRTSQKQKDSRISEMTLVKSWVISKERNPKQEEWELFDTVLPVNSSKFNEDVVDDLMNFTSQRSEVMKFVKLMKFSWSEKNWKSRPLQVKNYWWSPRICWWSPRKKEKSKKDQSKTTCYDRVNDSLCIQFNNFFVHNSTAPGVRLLVYY